MCTHQLNTSAVGLKVFRDVGFSAHTYPYRHDTDPSTRSMSATHPPTRTGHDTQIYPHPGISTKIAYSSLFSSFVPPPIYLISRFNICQLRGLAEPRKIPMSLMIGTKQRQRDTATPNPPTRLVLLTSRVHCSLHRFAHFTGLFRHNNQPAQYKFVTGPGKIDHPDPRIPCPDDITFPPESTSEPPMRIVGCYEDRRNTRIMAPGYTTKEGMTNEVHLRLRGGFKHFAYSECWT